MTEISNNLKGVNNRSRAQTNHNFTFKSGIFQTKQYLLSKEDELSQSKPSINANDYFNLSPHTKNQNNKLEIGNKNNNPENFRIQNKQMINSTILGLPHNHSVGSLFDMARQVSQPHEESQKIKSEIQKNRFSFLQIPKLSLTKNYSNQNTNCKIRGSVMAQQNKSPTPSFLKKNTKSSYDPQQENTDEPFKKQLKNEFSNKKLNFGAKSETQQQNLNNITKNYLEPNSAFLLKNKAPNISPINSSSSYKNKSTNQPQESPSNNKLLNPNIIPQRNQRKSSMIIENQKQFLTPTQKNQTKTGSSNLIQIPQKHNTAKNSNKSQFLLIHEQKTIKGQQCLTSRNDDKKQKSKTYIPSFIKFKEKRNQLINNSSQQFQDPTLNSQCSINLIQQKKISLSDFQIKERLGKGAFGDVFLARQIKSGFFCVLKKLSKKKIRQQNLQQHITRQIKIQSFLNHKHLTNLFGFFDDAEYIYLILEYLSDGSLAQKFPKKKCPEKQVAIYLKQVCEGLKCMHIEDIIHRDIKPQNIFIHEDYIKIGDFGCSVRSNTKRNTMVGCLAYLSPQQLNNESYDDKIDVWSVGILCYQLLTGRPPFEDDIIKIARQEKDAKLSQLRFPTKLQFSEEAKDFTRRLLAQNPEDRLTITQALKHTFIIKNNTNENGIIFFQGSLKGNRDF